MVQCIGALRQQLTTVVTLNVHSHGDHVTDAYAAFMCMRGHGARARAHAYVNFSNAYVCTAATWPAGFLWWDSGLNSTFDSHCLDKYSTCMFT